MAKLCSSGFLLLLVLSFTSGEELQIVDQAEFIKLITEEHFVVTLFCPSSSLERCEEFEGELTSIREDMIDVMDGDAWVVKLMDSPLVEEYAVGKTDQPVIVMFRRALPVIYDGPANEEVMLDTLVRYMLPGVGELTDSTFEHQTQAATGATTGDWLVMFFTSTCHLCHRLTATLESVGCKHRGRINVARVNKETYGEKTGRRFELGLEDKPDIIFFRLGKMYRYKGDKYDPETLSSFMTATYEDQAAEDIPLPKSPLSDLLQLCLDYLSAYPLLVGACLCVPILLLVAFLLIMRSEDEPKPRKTKKKKKEEQKEKKESKKDK
eukprot:TRINITY_DN2458_c0_g1_i11.p1 TRINITY_DN2458_c0_g1~~TRINITY_DN2458_c0_g1_i11.p1  ORF type:complete len:323 (+),score=119.46 TRINITY_DN2458_c0_g1_i11:54-1022(+)